MHLTHGHYARSWGYRILAMCQIRKSEEPLVVNRFLTWWLIDVCGSSAILLAVHLSRTTTELLQRVSDKYRPTESDQQEDLATFGSVQLRRTLALWTLASRLPGETPLLETNGDILLDTATLQYALKRKKKRQYHWTRAPDFLATHCDEFRPIRYDKIDAKNLLYTWNVADIYLYIITMYHNAGLFSVQFYTKTAVLNGFVQFWKEVCAVLKMT